MLDNKAVYPYDQMDASSKRNIYMYSDYDGIEFMERYFKSRNEVVKKIDTKIIPELRKGEHKLPPFEPHFSNAEEIIDSLLTGDHQNLNFKAYLDLFLKKFEVAHRVLRQYELGDTSSKQEISLISYMKLAYIFSEYIKTNFSLKYLNSLLKLNDKIIFLLRSTDWNIVPENGYITCALNSEINFVKGLFEKCQK